MLDKSASTETLRRLFRRVRIADIKALFTALGTRSRMSVFRRLREVGYLSSYTHSGGYYTLPEIPRFDEQGLWFQRGVGFSRQGTLKATLMHLVEISEAGYTHGELEGLLRLRVHNTLLVLVHEDGVSRQEVGGAYLYGSVDSERRAAQLLRRREREQAAAGPVAPSLPASTIIEVLVEALHASRLRVSVSMVVARLATRGVMLTVAEVERVFAQYGVSTVKKTAVSASRCSRG